MIDASPAPGRSSWPRQLWRWTVVALQVLAVLPREVRYRRRVPKPLGVEAINRDPVFGIELAGAPPGEVHRLRGQRPGAFSAGPSEVTKVWWAMAPMGELVADAVRQVRAVGGRVTSMRCSERQVVFRGQKALSTGEIAVLEVWGRGTEIVATIRLTLVVGSYALRVGEPARFRSVGARLTGDCAPELVAVLDEQADRAYGT